MNMFQCRWCWYNKEFPYGWQSSVELIKVTSQQLREDRKKHFGAKEGKKKKQKHRVVLNHKKEMVLAFSQLKDTKGCKLLKANMVSLGGTRTERVVQIRGGAVLKWPGFESLEWVEVKFIQNEWTCVSHSVKTAVYCTQPSAAWVEPQFPTAGNGGWFNCSTQVWIIGLWVENNKK